MDKQKKGFIPFFFYVIILPVLKYNINKSRNFLGLVRDPPSIKN